MYNFSQSQQLYAETSLHHQKLSHQSNPLHQSRITNFFPTTSQNLASNKPSVEQHEVVHSSNTSQSLVVKGILLK